jgi:serine protease Do
LIFSSSIQVRIFLMLWKKTGLLCIVLAALAIAGFAQTSARQSARSANLQMAMPAGYLGVGVQEVTPERAKALNLKDDSGMEVTNVTEDGPAAKAGVHVKDVILEVSGQKVDSGEDFLEAIGGKAPGTKVSLTLLRNGAKQTITATLGSRPPNLPTTGMMIPPIPPGPLSPDDIQAMAAGEAPKVGFDGIALSPQLAEYFGVREGVLVSSVSSKTPAEKAGLKAGDVVTKVNGMPVSSPREISGIVRQSKKTVSFTIVRNKKEMTLSIEIARNRQNSDSGRGDSN